MPPAPHRPWQVSAGPTTYLVGGAVRDELLGLPVADRDWVVVGSTPEALLAQGFRPVGRDFPVFLHPRSNEEYALARTERKSGRGYHGFAFHAAPEVSLEDDLARRDLTINAMARAADGQLIDPHGGARDLANRVFRHVGPAFAEDPVRILRLARFAARFADFTVAPETRALMLEMVAAGEADQLVAERVWQELSRGLMEDRPSRMLCVLHDCGALARLLPEVAALFGVPQRPESHPEIDCGAHLLLVLDAAAAARCNLAQRWAALTHDLGKGTTPASDLPRHPGHEQRSAELAASLSQRLRVPGECADLARLTARWHGEIHAAASLSPEALTCLLEHCDALRRPQRFAELLEVCAADFRGRAGYAAAAYPQQALGLRALAAMQSVDAGAIARQHRGHATASIPAAIHAARVAAVAGLK